MTPDSRLGKSEGAEKRTRQRLVVHLKNGRTARGFCLALNKVSDGFNLELVDENNQSIEKSVHIPFGELKAVFYVKSFDGRFNPEQHPHEIPESAIPVVLEFFDGEIVSGFVTSPKYMQEPRFLFIPEDAEGNNLSILVERTAVLSGMTPEEYKQRLHKEFESFLQHKVQMSDESRTELEGDFYFGKGNYQKALRKYREVEKATSGSPRLSRKMTATLFNVGICNIRKHNYGRALQYMEMVLTRDPDHSQAQKRAEQLRAHLMKKRMQQPGSPA